MACTSKIVARSMRPGQKLRLSIVTKPMNRPRGRPRKDEGAPAKERRPAHRPRMPLRRDQYGFVVALAYTVETLSGCSQLAGVRTAFAAFGRQVPLTPEELDAARTGKKVPLIEVPQTYGGLHRRVLSILEKARGKAQQIDGVKIKGFDRDDQAWLTNVSLAFAIALAPPRDLKGGIDALAKTCAAAGDIELAFALAPVLVQSIGATARGGPKLFYRTSFFRMMALAQAVRAFCERTGRPIFPLLFPK